MYAKKSLGQHFLRSPRALEKIIESGEISPDDTILEIGPGEGVLTQELLKLARKVIAVEKDDLLFLNLTDKFKKEIAKGKLELIHADILELKLDRIGDYKLIANIPYNITGAILKKFLSEERQPERMVLLVQKEVAERIVARDGKESILSMSVKAYGKPHYVETVKAGSFAPPPKVDSAIILISDISRQFFSKISEIEFFKLLNAAFKAKRKKVSSNLSVLFDKSEVKKALEALKLDENARAEDIEPEMWRKIAQILTK